MADIEILPATEADIEPWVQLHLALWPDNQEDDLRLECEEFLADPHQVAFIAWVGDEAVGLIEGSLRGSTQQAYGHVEGWYVSPEWRGDASQNKKVAYELMGALDDWFVHHSIEASYSDTNQDYPLSPRAHEKAGYEEVGVIRLFRKIQPR